MKVAIYAHMQDWPKIKSVSVPDSNGIGLRHHPCVYRGKYMTISSLQESPKVSFSKFHSDWCHFSESLTTPSLSSRNQLAKGDILQRDHSHLLSMKDECRKAACSSSAGVDDRNSWVISIHNYDVGHYDGCKTCSGFCRASTAVSYKYGFDNTAIDCWGNALVAR